MYIICRKLKITKIALKKWATNKFGDGSLPIKFLKAHLQKGQVLLATDPTNLDLVKQESSQFLQLNAALDMEASTKR